MRFYHARYIHFYENSIHPEGSSSRILLLHSLQGEAAYVALGKYERNLYSKLPMGYTGIYDYL